MATREHSTTAPESATAQPLNIKIGRRALFAGALAAPLIAAAQNASAAPSDLIHLIDQRNAVAQTYMSLLWVQDDVTWQTRGEPSVEQQRAFDEADSTLTALSEDLLDCQPQTLRELAIKAEALVHDKTGCFEPKDALEAIGADIATLAGAI